MHDARAGHLRRAAKTPLQDSCTGSAGLPCSPLSPGVLAAGTIPLLPLDLHGHANNQPSKADGCTLGWQWVLSLCVPGHAYHTWQHLSLPAAPSAAPSSSYSAAADRLEYLRCPLLLVRPF